MTHRPGPHSRLAESLEHELRHLAQLIDVLETERADLIASTNDRIGRLAAEKLHRIQTLDTYTALRTQLMRELGLPVTTAGMAECIAQAEAQGPRLQTLWEQIAERATYARELNELNGTLIRTRLNSVQARLAQMHEAAGNSALYGADGLSQGAALSRPLGNV